MASSIVSLMGSSFKSIISVLGGREGGRVGGREGGMEGGREGGREGGQ